MKNLSIKYIFYLALYMLAPVRMKAQHLPNEDIVYYITQYADIAINEMVRTGVPASIKIAQGILETQAGKSKLVAESNNHFGIKCKSNWDGPKVYHDDDAQGECFRKYKDAISSYKDHSDFLKLQPRYTSLFELDVDDYKGWAWGLKKAGYATNPIYAETLIKFIEDYQLNILNDYAEDEEQEKYDLSEYIGEITKNGLTPSTVTTKSSSSFSNKKISYPEDVFKINNVKVIYAPEGTSLLAVAKKYKIALPKLLSYNELLKSNSVLKKSELVFLQPKKSVGNKSIHRVKRNESLRDISQHEGIKLASLLQYNQLKANSKLKVGQKLNLKPKKGTSYKQPVKSSKKKKSRRK
ncbi:MAG: glucosaminidase domain-containing protein [Bacteroidota bacterium]|jgi:LysM repeat protein|nr:glucosaminidase domain-containing protein [Chitinophagaceae bacterium]